MNLGKKEIDIAQVSDFFSQSTGFVLDPMLLQDYDGAFKDKGTETNFTWSYGPFVNSSKFRKIQTTLN